jgi:hypothetical protein
MSAAPATWMVARAIKGQWSHRTLPPTWRASCHGIVTMTKHRVVRWGQCVVCRLWLKHSKHLGT